MSNKENQSEIGVENTDRELWREHEDDYYSNSIRVTEQGAIAIGVGGHMIVKRIEEWHKLAKLPSPPVEKFGEFFTCWERVSIPDRPDFIGVRTRADGRREFLTHNEGMCYPYYLTVEGGAAPVPVERTQDEPKCPNGHALDEDMCCVECNPEAKAAAGSEEPKFDKRGGSVYLTREQWGYVCDGLISQREALLKRKGLNPMSNADESAQEICEVLEILDPLSEAAPVAPQAPAPQPDDYRPSHLHLSNSEVRATGIIAGGACQNIARELLELRGRVRELEAEKVTRDMEIKLLRGQS